MFNLSSFLHVCFMWRKAVVYHLEWLKGNTPHSLCTGTGDNNERLFLMPGNPINFWGFVCAGAKMIFPWSIPPVAPKLAFAHILLEEKGRIGRWGGIHGPERTGCGLLPWGVGMVFAHQL